MNILKPNGRIRLIAFFLVAVMLVCIFGFTVDGWSVANDTSSSGTDSVGDSLPLPPSQDNATGEENDTPTDAPQIYIPKYTSYITGLEVSEEVSKRRATAVVMSADGASYAISKADLLAEFPIEDGSTRYLAFFTDFDSLGKIGPVLPTRSYVSNIACFFDSLILSHGIDDSVFYNACDHSSLHFDLTKHSGYHYSEFTQYQYTNNDLLKAGIKNIGLSTIKTDKEIPYSFNEFGKDAVSSETVAKSISISYSDIACTEFVYSSKSSKYTMLKNGEEKKDMLSGENVSFANCLVLFADSITYESANGSQMVMSTTTSGTGYYFTNGSVFNISWSADTDGNMTLFDKNGSKLVVNRGNTYIAFVRSSKMQSVTFK